MDDLTTVAAVRGYLALPAERDAELAAPVAAVNAEILTWHSADYLAAHQVALAHGATMLAARLYRRRSSPSGVETFGELGPTYVARYDSDLSRLLGVDAYTPPRVG